MLKTKKTFDAMVVFAKEHESIFGFGCQTWPACQVEVFYASHGGAVAACHLSIQEYICDESGGLL